MKSLGLFSGKFGVAYILILLGGLIITLVSATSVSANSLGVPDSEYNALIDLFNNTDGPSWYNTGNWFSNNPSWYGVTVSGGHVTGLSLGNNGLFGPIPDSLGNLTKLQWLYLYDNYLYGSIDSLCNLSNLTDLELSGNQFSGPIPSAIGNLTNLQYLALSTNPFYGSIPPSIGNLVKLQQLFLDSNQLSGSIPDSFKNLTNLQYLSFNNNQLSGSIPSSFGNLSSLQDLDLGYNQLTGQIPTSLGNLKNLQVMFLDDNQLTGPIPDSLGNLTNLQYMYIWNNQLTSSIPSSLGSLTNLQNMYMYNNQLTGPIPDSLCNLTNLRELVLYNNHLTGQIPSSIGNLTNLQKLELYNNQLSGQIPDSIGNLSSLYCLRLDSNQLSGNIPIGLGNLNLSPIAGVNCLSFNSLFSNDWSLCERLDDKFPGWEYDQTVPPNNVITINYNGDIRLSWDPIKYTKDGGYYEVGYGTALGGPYTYTTQFRTANKSTTWISTAGLPTSRPLYLAVRTTTPANSNNSSTLISSPSVPFVLRDRPMIVRINTLTDSTDYLTPPNPVTVAGRVTTTGLVRINDGSGEVIVNGISANLGQLVIVTGIWESGILSATETPIIYN